MVENNKLTRAITLGIGAAGALYYFYSRWRPVNAKPSMEKNCKAELEKEKPKTDSRRKEVDKKETRRKKTKEEKVTVRVPCFHSHYSIRKP